MSQVGGRNGWLVVTCVWLVTCELGGWGRRNAVVGVMNKARHAGLWCKAGLVYEQAWHGHLPPTGTLLKEREEL